MKAFLHEHEMFITSIYNNLLDLYFNSTAFHVIVQRMCV